MYFIFAFLNDTIKVKVNDNFLSLCGDAEYDSDDVTICQRLGNGLIGNPHHGQLEFFYMPHIYPVHKL